MSDIFRDYSFGGWLRHWRMEAGLTLRDVATVLNTDAANISKMERNELPPPRSALRVHDICKAYQKTDGIELLKSMALQHHIAILKAEFEK